ncbi:MAG: Membrane protein insertase YidC [Chlamydiia bacterium]|nr:Membrane protein insertase YidC [Chlamydiia bacterium]MCH9618149.1 Membrane protein insertase YidC [Chlamydiia bacterium]MCH9624029.1 Membrane protein insertase YidC [Chlamydiia bacterium]
MNKRSFLHMSIIMGMFVLLNTFVLNKDPIQPPSSESLATIDIEHLPVGALKNSVGHTICSTVTLGDAFVTLSSDNLPKTLLKNNDKVHLIKKCENGILIYSSKISPLMESYPALSDGDELLILSNLSSSDPKVSPATYTEGKIHFLAEVPETDGIAVIETIDGLAFSGLWDNEKEEITSAAMMEDLKNFVANNQMSTNTKEEKFYCLENDLMQVVFSDRGGAISEINLKLNGKTDKTSTILPVALDRKIAKQDPLNNKYPLQRAYIADGTGHTTYKESVEGGYIPLIRRDILDKHGKTSFKVPAKNYALALINQKKPEVSTFRVAGFTKDSIQFKGHIQGKEVTRSYKMVKNSPYTLEMVNSVNGNIPSLVISSGIPEVESDTGGSTPALLYYNFDGKKMKLKSFKMPKETLDYDNISPNWVANTNGFFATILNPKGENPKEIYSSKIEGKDCPSRVTLVDVDKALNPNTKFPGYVLFTPYKASAVPSSSYFYCGPLEKSVLTTVDKALSNEQTGANPEFIKALTVRGWLTFVTDPFSKFMNIIIDFYHMITGSWGVSIILLTITLHMILYPFSAKAFKSMIKMRKLAPKLKDLESKYKNDPKRLRMEQAMFYKNEGVNPLSSLLPMLLPIPFFIGMFDLLRTKFAMRGVVFIPGWIDNLTAPDVVFSWGVNIPFLGNEFHLLPILGALAMHFSQKFGASMQPAKKNPTDMEKSMQSMGPILTVVFLFFFYNLPSGLNIYLIVSSLLRMLQQWYVNRKFGDKNPGVSIVKNK